VRATEEKTGATERHGDGADGTGTSGNGTSGTGTSPAATDRVPTSPTAADHGAGDRLAATDAIAPYVPGAATTGTGLRSVVETGLQARILERSEMARTRRRRRLAWAGAGAVLLLAIVWALFWSPLLALDADRITVTASADTVDVPTVEEIALEAAGTPLPRLGTVALRDRIKDVRGVRDVVITRQWPRGLKIAITARAAVVAVPDGTDGYVLLDADAVQVGRATKVPKDLPVVSVPVGDENARVLEAVLVVVNALPDKIFASVDTVAAQTQDDITLTLRDGATVIWGGSQDSSIKIKVLQTLRADKTAKTAKVFDVSAPTAPITK